MNKTILITGSSSGIGESTAHLFQEKGWNVAATMRNPERYSKSQGFDNIAYFRLDVTNSDTINQAIEDVIERFGKIDVVVNNAAYSLTGPFEAGSTEQIQALYDVDVFGVMNVTRAVIPYFRKWGNGIIVNISSLGGRVGIPQSSFYASAKWAVEGFSESIRFELKKLGIRIKIIEPGGVKTNFAKNSTIVRMDEIPSYKKTMDKRIAAYEKRRSRLSDPSDIAEVVYRAATDHHDRLRYLAGDDAKFFWRLKRILPFPVFTRLVDRLAG